MKKLLRTVLTISIILSMSLTMRFSNAGATGMTSSKIDLSSLLGQDRLTSTSGTRMMGWDTSNNVISVTHSYEDQWCGGTGKGFLIDGAKYPVNFNAPLGGFYLSANADLTSGNDTSTVNETIVINLQQKYGVDKFAFYGIYETGEGINTGFPTDFTIQTSENGTDWETAITKAAYASVNGQLGHEFSFAKVNAQYIKFHVTKIASPVLGLSNKFDLALTEVEIFGSDPIAAEEPTPSITEDPTPSITEEPIPSITEEPTAGVTQQPTPTTVTNQYVTIGANGKLNLTAMLGGLSGSPALVGWDQTNKFIKTSKSFEVGWVKGYGKAFLIDGVVGDGNWPVSAGQFIAANLASDNIHVDGANASENINEYVELNLQSVFNLNKFGFTGIYLDEAAKQSGVPSDFTIQVSEDGITWKTVVTKTGYVPTSGSLWNEFSFASTKAQYIRLNATKAPKQVGDTKEFGYTLAFTELSVYGSANNGSTSNDIVNTSDNSNVLLTIILLMVFGSAIITSMCISKKQVSK